MTTDDKAGNGDVIWFEQVGRGDVARVGGKNASLGEMVRNLAAQGVRVPPGFATTARAYWRFVEANGLKETIASALDDFTKPAGRPCGNRPRDTARSFCAARGRRTFRMPSPRPTANFAGNPERRMRTSPCARAPRRRICPTRASPVSRRPISTFAAKTALLDACRRCYASLFTDRAIAYRQVKGFDHLKVALSIGVQAMVRSDIGGAGVMFSIDTETGFDKVVLINAAWGLGENVVQGAVDPDEYQVFKPLLAQLRR